MPQVPLAGHSPNPISCCSKIPFDIPVTQLILPHPFGAVVQLGERLTGSQEVRGSTPLGSIFYCPQNQQSRKTINNRSVRSSLAPKWFASERKITARGDLTVFKSNRRPLPLPRKTICRQALVLLTFVFPGHKPISLSHSAPPAYKYRSGPLVRPRYHRVNRLI